MKEIIQKILPHAVAVTLFILATVVYFSPMFFDGKQLGQHDIKQANGNAQEVVEYRDRTGNEALWTNSIFSGMPAYHISVGYPNNWLQYLNKFLSLGLPSPAYMIFFAFLGFYIMLLCFRVKPWMAIAGAFAYGLSTYFLIIAGAGHNTKMRAMAFMPMIIGGLYLAYTRGKMWMGMLLMCLALGLQIRANHLQITYYTAIVVLIFIIFEMVRVHREKLYAQFLKTSAAMMIAVTLAVGANITNMLLTAEYTSYSTRGQSELTDETGDKTSGLDKSYIYDYCYGVAETMNLFIPNFMGGASGSAVSANSPYYQEMIRYGVSKRDAAEFSKSVPTYWGGQRLTSGPVYIGAVVIFLFILGLFVVRGPIKWWLVTTLILSVMLAWGSNFRILSDLFIDFFPGYNKFRTVSMILVIAELVIPLLGILALKEMFGKEMTIENKQKALKMSLYIAGGVALFFALFSGLFFNFSSPNDAYYGAYYGLPEWLVATLPDTRQQLLRNDAFRTLFFVTAAAAVLWFTIRGKLKYAPAIFLLTGLIVVDLWTVDKRYLNDADFKAKGVNIAKPSPVDLDIMQDKSLSYRVMNTSVSTFNDATTSFFHKSIGGYHGAKMKRYQELIERHIGRGNMAVLNMLNTKYFIVADKETRQPFKQTNPGALGNAWTVDEIRWVENADAEIAALGDFNPARELIVDQRYKPVLEGFSASHDSLASIRLVSYEPNHLVYEYQSQLPQMVVFSEIFYSKGWNAYINGEPSPHIRANYVLRAMTVPAGNHEIVFRFEPKNYIRGEKIALASSIGILLLILGVAVKEYFDCRKKK